MFRTNSVREKQIHLIGASHAQKRRGGGRARIARFCGFKELQLMSQRNRQSKAFQRTHPTWTSRNASSLTQFSFGPRNAAVAAQPFCARCNQQGCPIVVRTISTPVHEQPTKEEAEEHNVAYVRCRQKKNHSNIVDEDVWEQKMAGPARCTQQVKQTDV